MGEKVGVLYVKWKNLENLESKKDIATLKIINDHFISKILKKRLNLLIQLFN